MIPAGARAVAFDAVGTVLHPAPGAPAVYAAAAERRGLDPAGLLDRLRDSYLAEEDRDRAAGWVTGEAREVARWRRIVRDTLPGGGPDLFHELYHHFATPSAWTCPPDAAPTFAALQGRGLKLALASNYDSRLEPVLAGRDELAPLRGRVVISSRVGVRKPGAAFFAKLCEMLGCEPGEVVYVGDDYGNDFVGARDAGLHAVLLDPAGKRPGAAPRIARLGELVALAPPLHNGEGGPTAAG